MPLRRLLAIVRKELMQLRRDRLTFAMIVGIPTIQLLLFGYAINMDVRGLDAAIVDQADTHASRALAQELANSQVITVRYRMADPAPVQELIRQGRISVALVLPPDLDRRLARRELPAMQLIVDGSDPQTVASATNTAASLVAARSSQLMVRRLAGQGAGAPLAPIQLEPNTWYNPDLRTAIYIVPGLVGVILTMTMVMLTAMAIARERERGTLEQLIVSPVKNIELVLGKIAPYIVIGYVQMTLILLAGRVVFDVPLVGSLAMLYALAFVFIAANLALGLFFSTLAKTQQQAMQMSFFFMLPNILLSGFMFPFEAMPVPAQWLSQALPLTHFLRIVRGITLRGAKFGDLTTDLGAMAIILAVLVTVASLRFSKKLA